MKQKALSVIKQAIDLGVKAGIYENLENIAGIINAFNVISTLEEPKDVTKPPSQGDVKSNKLKAVPRQEKEPETD